MLPFRPFYNSVQDFAMLNVICFHFWIITIMLYTYTHTCFSFSILLCCTSLGIKLIHCLSCSMSFYKT
jgi:hypothetical protein